MSPLDAAIGNNAISTSSDELCNFRKRQPRVVWATDGQGSWSFSFRYGSWLSYVAPWFSAFWVHLNQALAQSCSFGTTKESFYHHATAWLQGQTHAIYFGTFSFIVANKCAVPFWFVCFSLERGDLALVESVTLRLGPCNSYGGDFSYIYFQMQIEPYSSTFCLLRNSSSMLLLEHVPC